MIELFIVKQKLSFHPGKIVTIRNKKNIGLKYALDCSLDWIIR